MKKIIIILKGRVMKIKFAVILLLVVVTPLLAIERKKLADVNTDKLTTETQPEPSGVGDSNMVVFWWIPYEFWAATFEQDSSISEAEKKETLEVFAGVSILAVCEADISAFGAFRFYPQEEVERNLEVYYEDKSEQKRKLAPMTKVKTEIEVFLSAFRPMLANAMGEMGRNMHFYVFDDTSTSSERLMNPYEKGNISLSVSMRNGSKAEANISLPLDTLHVPRKCPNGKDAHISWSYCPWTGKKLED